MERKSFQNTQANALAAAETPAARLYGLINSAWITQVIYVAAELDLPEKMRGGMRDVSALATATACSHDAMRRLLRALCAVGICADQGNDAFSLTEMGTLLCEDAPESLRNWARLWGNRLWTHWGALLDSVRTGAGWQQRIRPQERYEQFATDDDAAELFYGAMRSITRIAASQVALLLDFRTVRLVVDVGGGHGEFMAGVLQEWPSVCGVCLDLPAAEAGAKKLFQCAGLDRRIKFVAGDFFVDIPCADALLLKSVLHNWDDARCSRILANCRRALSVGAHMFVVERILPDIFSDCHFARSVAQADLNMLVGIGGRERTITEYKRLLAEADFELEAVHSLRLGFELLQCASVTKEANRA